jgi:HEAT repeat protein
MTTRLLGALGAIVLLTGAAVPGGARVATLSAQVSFESTVAELGSPDPGKRLKAVQLLKAAAYPEAAVPLAPLTLDPFDEIQLEAISAELNIFLADKVTPKRRVGLLVEVRQRIEAEPTFSAGPSALGPHRVPAAVVTALANASRDPNARVAVEALYAFGSLAGEVKAADRGAMLSQSGPVLAATIGAIDPMLRLAAIRVIGRVFARRATDPPVEESVGDAVIMALNDREATIQLTAMWALGTMKYQRAVQGLTELFRYHERGQMAEAALDALARIAHPSSLPLFVSHLSSKNAALRTIAVEGLARSGDRTRADNVQTLANAERNDAVLLASHFANVQLAGGAVDSIIEALTRSRLRDEAWQYLFELSAGGPSAFARHLQDPDERIRRDLVDILGMSGDPAAAMLVEPLTNDRAESVAHAAARAVARLRG